jgi:hypothetical protein
MASKRRRARASDAAFSAPASVDEFPRVYVVDPSVMQEKDEALSHRLHELSDAEAAAHLVGSRVRERLLLFEHAILLLRRRQARQIVFDSLVNLSYLDHVTATYGEGGPILHLCAVTALASTESAMHRSYSSPTHMPSSSSASDPAEVGAASEVVYKYKLFSFRFDSDVLCRNFKSELDSALRNNILRNKKTLFEDFQSI